MLLLLAHYKMIDDDNALQYVSSLGALAIVISHRFRFGDLLRRRETTGYVEDLVNLDRVRSLLRMITCRKRFAAIREERAAALRAQQHGKFFLQNKHLED